MTHPNAQDAGTGNRLLVADGWHEYELLDSGSGAKLERWGSVVLVRPEPQAIWRRRLGEREWARAAAELADGKWTVRGRIPEGWSIAYGALRFGLELAPGGGVGLFPENAPQWDWIARKVGGRPLRVLNLFGHTGGATLAAAAAGAEVAHIDASRPAIAAARASQELSGLGAKPIRWIADDALAFVEREARRSNAYHGIILDPPWHGRGQKKEVWRLFEGLPKLLAACRAILRPDAEFAVLTTDALHASALTIAQGMEEAMEGLGGTTECGELALRESGGGRLLATSVYARWSR